MEIWKTFVDVLLDLMHYFSGVFGNTGLIILLFSLVVRFALLPLSILLARRSKERQEKLDALKPELLKIKQAYVNQPERAAQKTMELYKKNGITFVDSLGITGFFVQVPLFLGMFQAISRIITPSQHFLWISNLARPDLLLTCITSVLTGVAGFVTPRTDQGSTVAIWFSVLFTTIVLWNLSAGIGIYWIASSITSLFQAIIMRNTTKKRSLVMVMS
jgi:YidC/Oxa1 family membrane protein insertase